MGRISTIETHKKREAIISDLSTGKPLAEISRQYDVSEHALARFRNTRNVEVLGEMPEEFSTASVVERMRELTEDARRLRVVASYATPAVRSRLIDSEAKLLAQLRDLLGIDAVAISDQIEASQQVGRALGMFARAEPAHAAVLAAHLREHSNLNTLADALSAQIQKVTAAS